MAKYKAGVYSGDAQGFAGPLKVNVTVSEEAIEKIDVIIQKETPNVGGKALPILIERALEKNSVDIDGVSGASGTTKAFKKAVGKALNRAQGIEEKEITYTPGTYAGEAKGFSAHIQVNVTVSKDKIEDIEVTQQYDTAEIGGRAMPIVIKRILAANSTEVDGVSGASLSSNGIKNAVNFALEVASGQREPLAKYKAGKYSSESDDMRLKLKKVKAKIKKTTISKQTLIPHLQPFIKLILRDWDHIKKRPGNRFLAAFLFSVQYLCQALLFYRKLFNLLFMGF